MYHPFLRTVRCFPRWPTRGVNYSINVRAEQQTGLIYNLSFTVERKHNTQSPKQKLQNPLSRWALFPLRDGGLLLHWRPSRGREKLCTPTEAAYAYQEHPRKIWQIRNLDWRSQVVEHFKLVDQEACTKLVGAWWAEGRQAWGRGAAGALAQPLRAAAGVCSDGRHGAGIPGVNVVHGGPPRRLRHLAGAGRFLVSHSD